MSQSRAVYIDHLRGFAMIVMIANHVSAYFLHIPIANFLWNIGEVSVPVFIYCSVASFLISSKNRFSWKEYIPKRLKRLLIPYWIYLALEAIRLYFQEGNIVDMNWIVKNITFLGGLDLNWLVLLFLYLLFLIPILVMLNKNNIRIFWSLFIICFLISLSGLFVDLHAFSRLLMIFGWTILVCVSILLEKTDLSLKSKLIGLVGLILTYLMSHLYLSYTGQKLFQYDHKYPPDIFHIAWGAIGMITLVVLFKRYPQLLLGKRILRFFSIYSYSIYFIHNLLIKIFFTWWWGR